MCMCTCICTCIRNNSLHMLPCCDWVSKDVTATVTRASSTEPECGGTQSNDGIVVQVWPAHRQQQSRDVEQEKYAQTGTSDLQKTKVKLRAWRCECVSVWACACMSQSAHAQITLTNAMVMRRTCTGFFSLRCRMISSCILPWEFVNIQFCFRVVWFVHSTHFGTCCCMEKWDKMYACICVGVHVPNRDGRLLRALWPELKSRGWKSLSSNYIV